MKAKLYLGNKIVKVDHQETNTVERTVRAAFNLQHCVNGLRVEVSE